MGILRRWRPGPPGYGKSRNCGPGSRRRRPRATPPKFRRGAIDGLALLGGPASRQTLEHLSAAEQPFAIRSLAAVALATIDLPAGAERAAGASSAAPARADPSDLFTAFLERKQGAAALAAAIAKVKLPPDVAKLGIRAVRASASNQPALVAALDNAGGLNITGPRMPRGAALRQMVADVISQGDPSRGEAIFRRQAESCQKCHAIGGVGGSVGPDLASIGASAPVDYLIESILEPSAKIKEGYHCVVATTTRGRIFTGIKLRQTDKDLILRGADDRDLAIPLATLDTQEISPTSLMPVGLADNLTRGELLDLVRFLSELGKVGPYSQSKAPIARRWEALASMTNAHDANLEQRAVRDDPNLTWTPVYSLVSGDLPLAGLPRFVRCRVQVADEGPVKFKLNSAAGLRIWIDRNPLGAAERNRRDARPRPAHSALRNRSQPAPQAAPAGNRGIPRHAGTSTIRGRQVRSGERGAGSRERFVRRTMGRVVLRFEI